MQGNIHLLQSQFNIDFNNNTASCKIYIAMLAKLDSFTLLLTDFLLQ